MSLLNLLVLCGTAAILPVAALVAHLLARRDNRRWDRAQKPQNRP